ncbi:transcriptional regulator, TetR family [Saccharicrinis carchari]|uniref:Transcriptional regulator, TetR family n=1 Tax=Saccharicrinis carchari TaxID=1168039 RepID=A0A521DE87_SACCC|nr:TetR/AcrR family transcriptional regulator [Saccharicrinis carchari]SMO69902.1 transcriptional regulator, TetR family [Saccharicrinis carchari]
MAKVVDESKLLRIKEASIELVVQKGYGGASISAIAHQAGVAVGYLYRFYDSKYALVSDLLDDKIKNIAGQLEAMMPKCSTILQLITLLVNYFFELALHQPHHMRFIYTLINDYRFSISIDQHQRIHSLCRQLLHIGKETREIAPTYTEEEIYLMTVIYPVQFINVRFKALFCTQVLSETDKERVVSLCMGALKGASL